MAQQKISEKYTFQEFCALFPGKVENLVLEKLREIQYLPRHLDSDVSFLKECMENVKCLHMFLGFDSPVVKEYIEGLNYEKDYIRIVSSFMKNPNKKLQESKNAFILHPLADLFTLSNFHNSMFYKQSSGWDQNILLRNWSEEVTIHNEQDLIAQVSDINNLFKHNFSKPKSDAGSIRLGLFKGICDLKMVCNDSILFRDVPLTFNYRTSSKLDYAHSHSEGYRVYQHKQEVKVNLGQDSSKREYANLIFNPIIKTQLVEYLLK